MAPHRRRADPSTMSPRQQETTGRHIPREKAALISSESRADIYAISAGFWWSFGNGFSSMKAVFGCLCPSLRRVLPNRGLVERAGSPGRTL